MVAYMFSTLRQKIMQMSEKYGTEKHPPPWQTFVLPTVYGEGNLHFVQKVFEGDFEVNRHINSISDLANPPSSMSCTHRNPQRNQ